MKSVVNLWVLGLGLSGCMGVHEDLGSEHADPALSALSAADSGSPFDDAPKPGTAPAVPANCTDEGAPQPAPQDCWLKAKECYSYAKDPAVCQALEKMCAPALPTLPPPAPDDAYTNCLLKAKECYSYTKDPADCDANWKICDALKKVPTAEEIAAQRKADYAACLDKAKQCYDYEKNAKVCPTGRSAMR